MRGLDGKVAVVTGGGNGIGRAACVRFAEEGMSVVVADLLEDAAAETVVACEARGARAVQIQLDTSDPTANDAMVTLAVEEFGAVDVLVTAAGITHAGYRSGEAVGATLSPSSGISPAEAFAATDLGDYERVMAVNLTGTLLSMQSVVRWMLEHHRGGAIVTIASIASKHPKAGTVPYGVSKAGVWMLTKHAAVALAAAGIRVNAVGPGFIETNMTAIMRSIPELGERFLGDVPMGRSGKPHEVAAVIAFLAGDESSYFTGEILHPDGGYFTD